jgi:hypothetical protein
MIYERIGLVKRVPLLKTSEKRSCKMWKLESFYKAESESLAGVKIRLL